MLLLAGGAPGRRDVDEDRLAGRQRRLEGGAVERQALGGQGGGRQGWYSDNGKGAGHQAKRRAAGDHGADRGLHLRSTLAALAAGAVHDRAASDHKAVGPKRKGGACGAPPFLRQVGRD